MLLNVLRIAPRGCPSVAVAATRGCPVRMQAPVPFLREQAAHAAVRWCGTQASRAEEEAEEDDEEVPPTQIDRNPISTAMRKCVTKHAVASFMLKQDPSKLVDTHDLEAVKMICENEGPLTSQCGRALEVIEQRMTARFMEPAEEKSRSRSRYARIVTGSASEKKRGITRTSIGTYLEFAQWYARIYYDRAMAKGLPLVGNDPLYILAKQVVSKAVSMMSEQARRKQISNRPKLLPNAILALGLLQMKQTYRLHVQPHLTQSIDGKVAYLYWINEWDATQLFNIIWGGATMGLHRMRDSMPFLTAALERMVTDEVMVTCDGVTLSGVLRIVGVNFKDATGDLLTSVNGLFNAAAPRITRLALAEELSGGAVKLIEGTTTAVAEAADGGHSSDFFTDDFDNPDFLIGSFDLGMCIDVVEAYSAMGFHGSPVHRAVAYRCLRSQEIRDDISSLPEAVVELMTLYSKSYNPDLFSFLCQTLSSPEGWEGITVPQTVRILSTLHSTNCPFREPVYRQSHSHLVQELQGDHGLEAREITRLRAILSDLGILDDKLRELLQ